MASSNSRSGSFGSFGTCLPCIASSIARLFRSENRCASSGAVPMIGTRSVSAASRSMSTTSRAGAAGLPFVAVAKVRFLLNLRGRDAA
jgi:hypothetical protein